MRTAVVSIENVGNREKWKFKIRVTNPDKLGRKLRRWKKNKKEQKEVEKEEKEEDKEDTNLLCVSIFIHLPISNSLKFV